MGLFGPKKGIVSKLSAKEAEALRKQNKDLACLSTLKNGAKIYGDKSYSITTAHGTVTIRNRSLIFEVPVRNLAIAIIPHKSKILYYSVKGMPAKQKADTIEPTHGQAISEREFRSFLSSHPTSAWCKVGPFILAGYPSISYAFSSEVTKGQTNVTIGKWTFKDVDKRVVKGFLIHERDVYIVTRGLGTSNVIESKKKEAQRSRAEKENIQEYDLSEVTKIHIEADVGNVRIYRSSKADEGIGMVKAHGALVSHPTFSLEARVLGDTFFVRQRCSAKPGENELTLDVYILNYLIEKMEVETKSGSIDYLLGDSGILDASLKTTSGPIRAKEIFAERLNLQTSKGSVRMKGAVRDLVASSVEGKLDIHHVYFEDGSASLSSTSGDIHYHADRLYSVSLNCHGNLKGNAIISDPDGFRSRIEVSSLTGSIYLD